MKSLSDYTEQNQIDLFEKLGVFFAFSDKQLADKRQEGLTYVSMGAGMICPKENAKELHLGLIEIDKEGIKRDLEENSVKDIIWREFANYEVQILCDPQDAIRALSGYGIPEERFHEEYKDYFSHCVENDYF